MSDPSAIIIDAMTKGRTHCEICGLPLRPGPPGSFPKTICGSRPCFLARRRKYRQDHPSTRKPPGPCVICAGPIRPPTPRKIGSTSNVCGAVCRKEKRRRLRLAAFKRQRDKIYAYVRGKLAADPEGVRAKSREYSRRWRDNNKEKQREAKKRWERTHPEVVKTYAKLYHARRSTAAGSCSPAQWAARCAYYGGHCWIPGCGKPGKEMDHMIAVSRGGSNWPANLRPVCQRHNAGRKNIHWRIYLARIAA